MTKHPSTGTLQQKIKPRLIKALRSGLSQLFSFCDRIGLHAAIAWIIRYLSIRYTRHFTATSEDEPVTGVRVLAFTRAVFDKDLRQLALRTGLEIVHLSPWVYRPFAMAFLPPQLRSQIHYHTCNTEADMAAKRRMQRAAKKVLLYLKDKLGIQVVLGANVNYYQDQAWALACQELGIPFIVIYKESIQADADIQHSISRHRRTGFHFEGHRVAVYNARARDMLVTAGIANPEQVQITGAPNTDALFDALKQDEFSTKDNVPEFAEMAVLFCFREYGAPQLWYDTLETFCEVAQDFRDEFRFIIKTKRDRDRPHVIRQIEQKNALSSVEVLTDISLDKILPRARLVCGPNVSTTLIKAMAFSASIIVPCWAEANLERRDHLILSDPESAAYDLAQSPAVFKELLQRYLRRKASISKAAARARQELIHEHLFRIDGHCSERVADLILQTLAECNVKHEATANER